MKNKLYLILLLFIFGFSFSQVDADTINEVYEYISYDDEGYDLLNGLPVDNINMSRTNRVEIARNSLDETLYFSDDNISHVLFFNSANIYMGYYNGDGSTLELATYMGDLDYNGSKYYITVPDGARKFALMNYNYEDTRDLVAYTHPSIDIEAWDGLTYRDIFEGNNLIVNGDFSDGLNDWYLGSSNSYAVVNGVLNVVQGGSVASGVQYHTGKTGILNEDDEFYFAYDLQYVSGINEFRSFYPSNTYEYSSFTSFTHYSYIIEPYFGAYGNVFRFGAYGGSGEYNIDNVRIYNFDDIFNGVKPDITEFETMLDYYLKYKDVSGDELTYRDIIGDSLHGTGKNNLIDNGDFSEDTDNWVDNYSTHNIINHRMFVDNDITTAYPGAPSLRLNNIYTNNHLFYIYFDFELLEIHANRVWIVDTSSYGDYETITNYYNDNSLNRFSHIMELSYGNDFRFGFYADSTSSLDNLDYYFDNLILFDLSSIFIVDEPDADTFEGYLDTWRDPLEEYYPNYYTASTMILNEVSYDYDNTPPVDPDFQDSLGENMSLLGIDSPQEKLFSAFVLMILVAVILGLKYRSTSIVAIVEVLLVIVFTVLGWFSMWFILIVAMIFVLLIILKALKGGNK